MPNTLFQKYKDQADPKYRNFPSWNIDPELKKEVYCHDVAVNIFCRYVDNKTAISYDSVWEMEELRRYGMGAQSSLRYKTWVQSGGNVRLDNGSSSIKMINGQPIDTSTGGDDKDAGSRDRREQLRNGWGNLDYQIQSYAPKISKYFHGKMYDVDFDILANAVDQNSIDLEENMMWGIWCEKQNHEWNEKMRARMGIPSQEMTFIPNDTKELEVHKANGGFKSNFCIEIEKLLKHSFDISDWHEIREKIIDDMKDLNMVSGRVWYNPVTKKEEIRYVDPKYLVMQYSQYYDHHDACFAGHIEFLTIGEVRTLMPKTKDSEIKIAAIAQINTDNWGNPPLSLWKTTYAHSYNSQTGLSNYDFFKVPVFYCSWIDQDAKWEKVSNLSIGDGTKVWRRDTQFGGNGELKPNQHYETTNVRMLYKAAWFIGTEYMLEYGIDDTMLRPMTNDVTLPYFLIKLPGMSITKTLRPHYDQTMFIALKLQNALAEATKAGWAIDISDLSDVQIGADKLNPLDIFELYKKKGYLLYSKKNVYGEQSSSGLPITQLPGGIGILLDECIKLMNINQKNIQDISGINMTDMGTAPAGDSQVSTTQMALSGTEKVLIPFKDAILRYKTISAEKLELAIIQLIKYNKESYDEYSNVTSKSGVEVLKQALHSGARMGIKLSPQPTEQQKQFLKQYIMGMTQNDRNGEKAIDNADALLLINEIDKGGNLEELIYKVSYDIKKAKQKAIEDARQNQILQGQINQQQEAAKHQHEVDLHNMKVQGEAMLEDKKAQNDMKEKMFEHNLSYRGKIEDQSILESNVEKGFDKNGKPIDNSQVNIDKGASLMDQTIDQQRSMQQITQGQQSSQEQNTGDGGAPEVAPQFTPKDNQEAQQSPMDMYMEQYQGDGGEQ